MAQSQSQYSLSWDCYKSNICTGFSSLQQNGEFVDMTLAADGHFVKVHQVLVALSSPYLKSIITSAPCQHPVIFLNNISHKTLCQLLEYIYTGEALVSADNLTQFVEAAKSLCIKGLENIVNNDSFTVNKDSKSITQTLGQMTLPDKARKVIIKSEDNTMHMRQSSAHKLSLPILNEDVNPHDYADAMDDTGGHDTDDSAKYITIKEQGAQSNMDTDKLSSKLQFSVSIRGALQIVLNRYIYNLFSKKRKGIRRWRCVDYRCHKCKAFVVTRDNVVLNRANPHNHPFHDHKILAKIEKNTIFSAIEDVKLKMDDEVGNDKNDNCMQHEYASGYSDADDKSD